MKKTGFIFAILLLFSICGYAQKGKTRAESYKKDESLKLVYLTCPNANIFQIDSKSDYLEVEYWCDGRFYEMGILKDRVLYIETEADTSAVPMDKINKRLSKDYLDWTIGEVTEIFTDDTTFIKVEILKDDVAQNLFFTHDGKWYKSTSFTVSGEWTTAELRGTVFFKNARYNLLNPDTIYELPAILREVSGITISDKKTILCVQDELGIVFEFDPHKNEIVNFFRFTDLGDFEGVATNGDLVYVLRSDGTVFNFNYRNRRNIETEILGINALNFESFTYDRASEKFYTVSKDAELNTPEAIRKVYEVTPGNFHKPKLAQEINIDEVNDFLARELPESKKPQILFNPSAIAIHPITKEMYVLSAADRLLLIYDNKGLKAAYPLPSEMYHKPEGITFYENGDMLISNEGDKKGMVKPSIMYFKNRKN